MAGVRRDLDPGERLDLLDRLAGSPGSPAREALEARAELLRKVVSRVNGPGQLIALVMAVVGTLLLAAVHLPHPAAMLRWAGIALLRMPRREARAELVPAGTR